MARICFVGKRLTTFQERTMAPADDSVVAVFGTVELLESILLRLNMKTLLLSQRVDRTFRDTIANSTKLQKALSFEPASHTAAAKGAMRSKNNPLFIGSMRLAHGGRICV